MFNIQRQLYLHIITLTDFKTTSRTKTHNVYNFQLHGHL